MYDIKGLNKMNVFRKSESSRSVSLSLILLFFVAGPGGLFCENTNADSEYKRPLVKISFNWKSDYYKKAKVKNSLAFAEIERQIKNQIRLGASNKFSFIEWNGESSGGSAVNEWIVEMETDSDYFGTNRKVGRGVYVNQYLKINGQNVLLTGNDKEVIPIANDQQIPYWAGRPPKNPVRLKMKLDSVVKKQLPILIGLPQVETELKATPITKNVDLDRDEVNMTFSLCDMKLNKGAEFNVVLESPPLAGDANRTTESFKFTEVGEYEDRNIIGYVSALSLNEFRKKEPPIQPEWIDALNKKVAISDAQVVMVSQYTARQDCIEIAPSGLAMTTTEPNDEL